MSVFDGLIGHERVVDLLGSEVDAPAQAYLFTGPSGVGKATVAIRFAALLLCESDSCRSRVLRLRHPDLTVVAPEGRTMMGVDQARATIAKASLMPVESARKVFIIDEGSSMSEAAANALLKTLEEPTGSTVFILIADAQDDLPATVASRSRVIRFGRVPDGTIAQALKEEGIEPERADRAAQISGGRPGLALGFATRPEAAEFRSAWLSLPSRLTERPGDAFRLAEEMLAASAPLLEAIRERHESELDALEAETGEVPKATKERYERTIHRASQSLTISGLEIMASWYTDAAAAQLGGQMRNPDLPVTELSRVSPTVAVANAERTLDAVVSLQQNQRPELVLADLLARLGVSA